MKQQIDPDPRKAVAIRNFEPGDAARVSEIICRCLREVNSKDYSHEQIDRMIPGFAADRIVERFADFDAVVAGHGGVIAGVGLLDGNEIRTMFVDPTVHASGIGTAIMNHLESLALSKGINEIVMFSSITARIFYEKRGYRVTAETDHPIGGKMFRVEKVIAS